jgi:hypothetical protein
MNRICFPHWLIFRIIQNWGKYLKFIKIILHDTYPFTSENRNLSCNLLELAPPPQVFQGRLFLNFCDKWQSILLFAFIVRNVIHNPFSIQQRDRMECLLNNILYKYSVLPHTKHMSWIQKLIYCRVGNKNQWALNGSNICTNLSSPKCAQCSAKFIL